MRTTNPESPLAAHSPVRWHLANGYPHIVVLAPGGRLNGDNVICITTKERAALIVHRVNAFDALVAALEAREIADEELDRAHDPECWESPYPNVDQINAGLSA